jgi:hypothetical protein
VVFGRLCAEFEPRTRSDFAFVNATTGEILATPGATAAELDATIGFCHRTFREFSPTAILLWWSHAQRWAAERGDDRGAPGEAAARRLPRRGGGVMTDDRLDPEALAALIEAAAARSS